MKIWVDAGACPKAIKEILYRVADRTEVALVFIANQLDKIIAACRLKK